MTRSNTAFLGALSVLWLAGMAPLSAGCGDGTSSNDGGSSPPQDANTGRDAGVDAAPDDVISDLSPTPDGDAGCACIAGGASEKATQPLACFCSTPKACPDYDSARSTCRSGAETLLEVYSACNLEIISFPEALAEGRKVVYDAATHAVVGASFATDTLSLECGSQRVIGYQAGTFPPADCAVSQRISLCGGDAGTDADRDTGDGGCACTTGDAATGQGTVSLDCYCSAGIGDCPRYEVALASCPMVAPPEFNRLEEYAGCNLAVISVGAGFGGAKYVYDYTTRALVGASRFTDVNNLSCGADRVFGYRAGTFPDPSCVQTNVVVRCAADGGDASAMDVTPDSD